MQMQGWMVTPWLFVSAAVLYIAFFYYAYCRMERLQPAEWIARRRKPPFAMRRARAFEKKDALPLAIITAVYAAVTFLNLGNTDSPQSFLRLARDESVVIELREEQQVLGVFYFTGLYHQRREEPGYRIELSPDGVRWPAQHSGTMPQEHSQTFRWMNASLADEKPVDTRFIRITMVVNTHRPNDPRDLGELSLTVWDRETGGSRVLTEADLILDEKSRLLFDEQHTVPERYDVLNSSHFDEIYHAHTAYQHLQLEYPYEVTHPPLGKLITALGIWIFGMTPFGWRFMPALFGVLMLPPLYLLLKWMFGRTSVAVCGTLLFAFDFMHFVQTRISTIDVYCVFFVLCMVVCMYRYITTDLDAPFWRTAGPLALAGLSFGLGAAAKWQSIYAGVGLLLLFLIYLFRRYSHCRKSEERKFLPFFCGTVLVAFVSFILIPAVLYIACYIPYVLPRAPEGGFAGMGALAKAAWEACWNNQTYMYRYHADLVATHSYSSPWYQWLVDWKPILYYFNSIGEAGTRGSLWAFTNPLTTWAGLGALIACIVGLIKRRCHLALFILIGYFSQLLPWIPVTRITFPYHYFPSMLFICIAMAYVFHRMIERDEKRGSRHMIAFTAAATALFVLFYPVLTGTQMPTWYPLYLLRWLPNWLM
jgi:4-amino-4-deoxy-L-arabinose transferase-like glycosyltransferase